MLKLLTQVLFIIVLFIISCGEDPYAKGMDLYNSGNYDAAIKVFSTIHNGHEDDPEFLEIFALAYMYKGQKLYNRTKNVKAFLGNYEKGIETLPVKSSKEFNKKHSSLLYSLANAFLIAKESNSREKDVFYSDAIKHLQTSILLDSTNAESIQLLTKLKEADFNNLLVKAEEQYTKANKTGNIDLYFSAKANLQKANLFNPDDDKIKSLNTRIRRKLLGVLDYQDGLAIAVTNSLRRKDLLTLKIAVMNYQSKSQAIVPYQFYLINSKGDKFQPDKKEMGLVEFLGKKSFKSAILDQKNSYVEGIIVYKIPENTSAHYIVYLEEGKEISRKYFY